MCLIHWITITVMILVHLHIKYQPKWLIFHRKAVCKSNLYLSPPNISTILITLLTFVLLTEMTTINISVVVLASLIFFDSFDSPLITLTLRFEFRSRARFFSASRMARKSKKFKITSERQGIQWTNKIRNL